MLIRNRFETHIFVLAWQETVKIVAFLFLTTFLAACDSGQNLSQRVQIINEISAPHSVDAPLPQASSALPSLLPSTGKPSAGPDIGAASPQNNGSSQLSLHKVTVRDVVGNQDNRTNRGETVELTPVFLNKGSSPTNKYRLRITCLNPLATPINPSQDGIPVASIPAGEVLDSAVRRGSGLQLRLDPQALPGTQIEVIFKLIDDLTQHTLDFPYAITIQP